MKDIYISMNTQNILRYYGTKLDLKLDFSEFYDYEISKNDTDYNSEVLDLTQPIQYPSLKINTTLEGFSCGKTTITLVEYDNRVNNPSYPYSGLTSTVSFIDFTQHIGIYHQYEILNNNVYVFEIDNEEHFMMISGYNQPISIDPRMGNDETEVIPRFSTEGFYKCIGKLSGPTACCGITQKLGVKPWTYQFLQPEPNTCSSPIINRREEKGWTIDFIFNRETLPWSQGGKFYYFGGVGDDSAAVDNSLSFGFTSDGRIEWTATRYSGYCDNVSGWVDGSYVESDITPILCTTGETKDFNITIVFDRNHRYVGCDLENEGGWNDLKGYRTYEYEDLIVTAVTSTQITKFEENEILGKKWENEQYKRLGTLKIYLNGRPIYKKENWEEVVPSDRVSLPFLQSWGGTPQHDINHRGVSCFNIKSIKYYEEPLDFIHVRHNFLTRRNQYDFFICGENCQDDLIGLVSNGLLTEDEVIILSETNDIIIY